MGAPGLGYTVLHVRASEEDVRDALGLLSPRWPTDGVTQHGRWSTIPASRVDARTLGPRLAALLGKPIMTVSVGDDCQLSVVRPDGRVFGPTDGRIPSYVAELAAELGARKAGAPDAARVLSAGSPPVDRHLEAVAMLGMALPNASERLERPGVVVVWAGAQAIQHLAPRLGHGAWIVRNGTGTCLLVPDGSGWRPTPHSFESAFAAQPGLRALLVSWGTNPTVIAMSEGQTVTIALQFATSAKALEAPAEKAATLLGFPGRGQDTAEILTRFEDAPGKVAGLLTFVGAAGGGAAGGGPRGIGAGGIGAGGVPTGATVAQLATWASNQDSAIHAAAGNESSVSLSYTDTDAMSRRFRRLRRIRRTRSAFGWLEAVAWLASLPTLIWGPRFFGLIGLGVVTLTIIIRSMLKSMLGKAD